MMLTTHEIAGLLKMEHQKIDEIATYLYPNKLVFTREEALAIRDYYVKYGQPGNADAGPFAEYMKLERIAGIYESRLQAIREQQTALAARMDGVRRMYVNSPGADKKKGIMGEKTGRVSNLLFGEKK